ncbi:MAG: nucleoside-diphosphate sugar epimerase/dehydratase [Acidimicrobiia bacterium]
MRGDIPLVLLDLVMTLFAYVVLISLRLQGAIPDTLWTRLGVFLPVACVVHLGSTLGWGGYGRTWRHASIDEARRLLLAGITSMAILLALFAWGPYRMPLSVLVFGPILATLLFGLTRFQSRLFAFRRSSVTGQITRVAVVGSGTAAATALREMLQDNTLHLAPVVIVDDDGSLRGRSLHGVTVGGGLDDLAKIVEHHDVDQILLALSDESRETVRRVADAADLAGVPVRVLRTSASWVRGMPRLRDIRELRIEDLLRREPVQIDLEPVRRLLTGRRVLVTGGGGWIGSEIARQVAAFDPMELAVLDHDETHLHDIASDLDTDARMVLADIRDAHVISDVFATVRPEVVFHAAAHKHVPILEDFPCEAVRTNVFGTLNVIDACNRHGVAHLVHISTDKAAKPTSVMGATKWIAEQILLSRGNRSGYCAVRFGNVLGSRGSVIPTFQRQIAAGGPVTVTSREMTRFFMSTDEAVRLVLVGAAVAGDRKILALEMGEQANMYELAERMIRLCGRIPHEEIEIRISGLRPGENLVEALIGPEEQGTPDPENPVIGITPGVLPAALLDETLDALRHLVAVDDNVATRQVVLDVVSRATEQRASTAATGSSPCKG